MRALFFSFLLFIAASVQAGSLTAYNSLTNQVAFEVSADGSWSEYLIGPSAWLDVRWSSGTASVWVAGIGTNELSDGSWSVNVSAGGLASFEGSGADGTLWPWFFGGFGLGLTFYAFGWQKRIVGHIGRVSDV